MLDLSRERKLEGRIWKIREKSEGPSGLQNADYEYDNSGQLVGSIPRFITASFNEDGERFETERLPGMVNHYWTMQPVSFLHFPTHGAAIAETTFDAKGDPKETIFRDSTNAVVSRVVYRSDESGRVVEVWQYNGALPATGVAAKIPILAESGSEQNHTILAYDDARGIVDSKSDMCGVLLSRIVRTFNERGDLILFEPESEAPFVFEYHYDDKGNWTRKITHHVGGDSEVRRAITYHPDGF